jgi:vacuolar-type H+-ATPase subunit I/STV1
MPRKIQKTMGKDILSRTKAMQEKFRELEQRNKALAKLVLREVPRTYYQYKTPEKAFEGISKMFDRARRVDYALNELGIKKIDPHFVDTVLHEKVITIGEVVRIKQKLDELEKLDKGKAKFVRDNLPGFLSRSPQEALGLVERQINAFKEKHRR